MKQELIESLKFLKENGVEIKWGKKSPYAGVLMFNQGHILTAVPEKPQVVWVYTNISVEENLKTVQDEVRKLNNYLDYLDKMEDDYDMLDIKTKIEAL